MNNLKLLRENKGLSQTQVAELMEVSQQAIAKWENGNALPRTDKLPLLAEILNCTVDELLED